VIVREPTLVVAAAGAFKTKALPTTTDPTLDVADCPVKPITSAGAIAPTDEVADCPAKIYATSVTSEPTEEVVESPVNVNERSDFATTEPTLEVAL
tara:strand:+ start:202 stop:489 length:288 start_codon:yes stop_codon:yes gene_type:complete